jgi:hypothetical protein
LWHQPEAYRFARLVEYSRFAMTLNTPAVIANKAILEKDYLKQILELDVCTGLRMMRVGMNNKKKHKKEFFM